MKPYFHDRYDAGRQLAKKLIPYMERQDAIVLALPRGGVPVGFEVAKDLHVPLDLMLVRKLGVPGEEELAMGAIALSDVCVFNHDVIGGLAISQSIIDHVIANEQKELVRRNRVYRHGEPPPNVKGRIVILVDDGMATGANMRAAVMAIAQQHPLRVVVAVPVSSREAIRELGQHADEIVWLHLPEPLFGIGQAYEDFSQIEDHEVMALLDEARHWGKGHVDFSAPHHASSWG